MAPRNTNYFKSGDFKLSFHCTTFYSTDQKGSLTFEAEILELVSFGVCDVGGLLPVVFGRQLELLLPVAGGATGLLLPGGLGTDGDT